MVRVRNVLKLASLSLGSGVSDLSPANYATGIPRRFLSHICAGEASWLHFGWKFTFSRQPCCSYNFQCLQDPLVFWCCGLGHVRSKLNKAMNGSKGKLTQTIVMLNHYYPTNAIIQYNIHRHLHQNASRQTIYYSQAFIMKENIGIIRIIFSRNDPIIQVRDERLTETLMNGLPNYYQNEEKGDSCWECS